MLRPFYATLLATTSLLLGGCAKGSEPAPAPVYLLDRQWQLAELQGQPVPATAESRTILTLSSTNNTSTGRAFCNQYGGGFTLRSGTDALTFSDQFSTQATCPDQSLETRYLVLLPQVRRYRISNRRLQLYNAGQEQPILVFEVGE